jgi:Ni2+-binding GTPase involved in maturation of urease and hydrogenase
MDVNYLTLNYFKVAVLGSAAVGKTAIINRLVNNYFPNLYEPTMEQDKYTALFSLNDYEVQERTYVMVTLEDTFGCNNPLLQTPPELISSTVLRDKREKMSETYKNFMFTSMYKREKLTATTKKVSSKDKKNKNLRVEIYEENFTIPKDEKIERRGFILVCDCSDVKSFEDIIQIISKLYHIEKTNNLTFYYPKCVFINKHDKLSDKVKANLKIMTAELDLWKKKCNLEYFKVSALTNEGLVEHFRKYLSRIHQVMVEDDQNDGFSDNENFDTKTEIVVLKFIRR